ARAEYEAQAGDVKRGAAYYGELINLLDAGKPAPDTSLEDAIELSTVYDAAAPVHRRAGRGDLAADIESRRLEIWRRWDSKLPNNAFVKRQLEAARLAFLQQLDASTQSAGEFTPKPSNSASESRMLQ